jgi:hypothetical protein
LGHGIEGVLHQIKDRAAERAGVKEHRIEVLHAFQLQPNLLRYGQQQPLLCPCLHGHAEILRRPLDGGYTREGQIILQEVIETRQLRLNLGKRLGKL